MDGVLPSARCADSPRGHRNFGGAGAGRIGEHSFSRIADLCAGSGCIGLTVACERPDAEVALLELSPKAGEYCKKISSLWHLNAVLSKLMY